MFCGNLVNYDSDDEEARRVRVNNNTDKFLVKWEMNEVVDEWVTTKGKAMFLERALLLILNVNQTKIFAIDNQC